MKKLFILLSAILSLGIVSTVYAANTGDTNWSNEYRVWSPNDYTPARKKTNATAYYNKVKTITSINYINIWAALGNGTDVSAGRTYKAYKGDVTFLYNLAAHENYRGSTVRIDSRRIANGSSTGIWSPDSVR